MKKNDFLNIYMNWLKQNWFKLIIIIFVLGAFGWYSVRPAILTRACHLWGLDRARSLNGNVLDYEYQYSKCLRANGINKSMSSSVLN